MSWFNEVFKDTNNWVKDTFTQIKEKPMKLLYGQDPLSIGVKNKIAGTDEKPMISMLGGPSEDTRDRLGFSDTSRSWYDAADTIAAMWGMSAFAGSSAGQSLLGSGSSATTGGAEKAGGSKAMDMISQGSKALGQSQQQAQETQEAEDSDSELMQLVKQSILGFGPQAANPLDKMDLLAQENSGKEQ